MLRQSSPERCQPDAAGVNAQLHVPIAGRQAVGVVIAAKQDHRTDFIRAAGDPEIEMPPV